MTDIQDSEHGPIIMADGVLPPIIDNRPVLHKKISVYLILISTTLERIAFYTLAVHLVVSLQTPELHWNSKNSTNASFIFFGGSLLLQEMYYLLKKIIHRHKLYIHIGFCYYQ